MPEAYLVEAVRTPVTRKGTGLAEIHPADLGAHVLSALVDRSGIDPGAVEDVVTIPPTEPRMERAMGAGERMGEGTATSRRPLPPAPAPLFRRLADQ